MNKSNKIINYDLIIIGGGASGLSAAISSSFYSIKNNKKTKIALVEQSDKVGKSILKTGNGRCNFSNLNIKEENGIKYYNASFVNNVFCETQKQVEKKKLFIEKDNSNEKLAAIQMLEKLGLMWKADSQNRLYPYTNKANTVLDVFWKNLSKSPVETLVNFEVEKISYDNNEFLVVSSAGKKLYSKRLIICTGSQKIIKNSKFLKQDFNSFKPILGPLQTSNEFTKPLDGIKAEVVCSLYDKNQKNLATEEGEILFRKYGVSGICIFNLSRFVNCNSDQILKIDFFPNITEAKLSSLLYKRFVELSKIEKSISVEDLLVGMLLPKISKIIAKKINLNCNDIKNNDIGDLVQELKSFNLKVEKITNEKFCQGSRGGIDVKALNKNLSYIKNENLYFAGEAIDVDGPCGGYNLHWAWTSGILAGVCAAQTL